MSTDYNLGLAAALANPEVRAQLAQLGQLDEEYAATDRQLGHANALRYMPTPQGAEVGNTYISAGPLEMLMTGLVRHKGGKDIKAAEQERKGLVGRERFAIEALVRAMRGEEDPMIGPPEAPVLGPPEAPLAPPPTTPVNTAPLGGPAVGLGTSSLPPPSGHKSVMGDVHAADPSGRFFDIPKYLDREARDGSPGYAGPDLQRSHGPTPPTPPLGASHRAPPPGPPPFGRGDVHAGRMPAPVITGIPEIDEALAAQSAGATPLPSMTPQQRFALGQMAPGEINRRPTMADALRGR